MFKPSPSTARKKGERTFTITFDGAPLQVMEEVSVAAALMLHGMNACRDTVVGEVPRGPFCMMGICYDCLVVIDGRPNRQACMTRVQDGMRVERQAGAREVNE